MKITFCKLYYCSECETTSGSKTWESSILAHERKKCRACYALFHYKELNKYASIIVTITYWSNQKTGTNYDLNLSIDKRKKIFKLYTVRYDPKDILNVWQSKMLLVWRYKKTS